MMSESEKVETQTIESKTAADYLDPTNEPEPSEETGLGTHFGSTFDPNMKKDAPKLPESAKSAKEKLAATSSTMTTAQLQHAATEGDPNNLMQTKR
ncbi:hypothetical protein AC579_9755 [Pseudocercospora musae]|uniref:Uncharacterized protein n=1 Tax=Pseudocercospora musae TaxID=113226 RepID=A0A139HVW8_9PEZI|nr:hypothetical protein AC579_9755 [Pseudocercospora musae]